jgi:hypothetical protein
MQNIYEQIDTMFSGENDARPLWACEILDELRELKGLLKSQNNQANSMIKPKHNFDKYDFVNRLREKLKPDVQNEIYPYIVYENNHYGVNLKGFVYNKTNYNETVTREKAFKIFDYIYSLNQDLDSLIYYPNQVA